MELVDLKNGDEGNQQQKKKIVSKSGGAQYTTRYRVVKTFLLHSANISLGINTELLSVVLEDLRILLNINYRQVASLLVTKIAGYVVFIGFIGFVLDRYLKYADLVIALSTILISSASMIIPWVNIYWISLILHLFQGCVQSAFDICANEETLRLWHGISNSPVGVALAGYGIGALISVYIAKPYVKFNPLLNAVSEEDMEVRTNNSFMNSTTVSSAEITLQVPYTICGIFGIIVGLGFFATFFYESKFHKHAIVSVTEDDGGGEVVEQQKSKRIKLFSLIYGDEGDIAARLIKSVLIVTVCFCIGGYTVVLNSFTLPYLTKGPARISLSKYFNMKMLYWVFYVLGRLLTTVIAFKINSLLFFTMLISLNFASILLLSLPALNTIELFYWFIIIALALFNGPLVPACLMIMKHIMTNVNAVLVSLFGFSLAIGASFLHFLTGYLLDEFQPKAGWFGYVDSTPTSVYIIPYVLLVAMTVSLLSFSVLVIVYKRLKKK